MNQIHQNQQIHENIIFKDLLSCTKMIEGTNILLSNT